MSMVAQAAAADGTTLLWGFVLTGVAVFLIALELIVPSGGMLALAAAASMVGAITAFFVHSTAAGIGALSATVVLGPVAAWLVWRWWSETTMARKLVLGEEVDSPDASIESIALVGDHGTVEAALRPVGTVRIGDRRLDALSEHGVIDAGTSVVVVEILDNQVKVRRETKEEGIT